MCIRERAPKSYSLPAIVNWEIDESQDLQITIGCLGTPFTNAPFSGGAPTIGEDIAVTYYLAPNHSPGPRGADYRAP
jgi:hypothetical protein